MRKNTPLRKTRVRPGLLWLLGLTGLAAVLAAGLGLGRHSPTDAVEQAALMDLIRPERTAAAEASGLEPRLEPTKQPARVTPAPAERSAATTSARAGTSMAKPAGADSPRANEGARESQTREGRSKSSHPNPRAAGEGPDPLAASPDPTIASEPGAASDTDATATAEQRSFGGRPIEKVRTIEMEVTAYSPGPRSCGKWADGQTASGYSVKTNGGKLVAADTDVLPFGTLITVPGYHKSKPVPVLDRGGAIEGKRLDVLYPTHNRALQWGRQTVTVTVWRYAD